MLPYFSASRGIAQYAYFLTDVVYYIRYEAFKVNQCDKIFSGSHVCVELNTMASEFSIPIIRMNVADINYAIASNQCDVN
jgi:hypothetical protein